jgi:hypothetical protein
MIKIGWLRIIAFEELFWRYKARKCKHFKLTPSMLNTLTTFLLP